jgi:hypothetical protein
MGTAAEGALGGAAGAGEDSASALASRARCRDRSRRLSPPPPGVAAAGAAATGTGAGAGVAADGVCVLCRAATPVVGVAFTLLPEGGTDRPALATLALLLLGGGV